MVRGAGGRSRRPLMRWCDRRGVGCRPGVGGRGRKAKPAPRRGPPGAGSVARNGRPSRMTAVSCQVALICFLLPPPSRGRAGVGGNAFGGLHPPPQPSPARGEGSKKSMQPGITSWRRTKVALPPPTPTLPRKGGGSKKSMQPGITSWRRTAIGGLHPPPGPPRKGEGVRNQCNLVSLPGDEQRVDLVVAQLLLAVAGVDHQGGAVGRHPDQVVAQLEDVLDLRLPLEKRK